MTGPNILKLIKIDDLMDIGKSCTSQELIVCFLEKTVVQSQFIE